MNHIVRPKEMATRVESLFPVRWQLPLELGAVVVDLDGTLMPSYKTLAAVGHLRDKLSEHGLDKESAADFVDQLRRARDFQAILHQGRVGAEFFADYIREQNLPLSAEVINEALGVAENFHTEAVQPYEGAAAFLRATHEAGVFVAIYTNSPMGHVIDKLVRSGLDPSLFDAIWAKNPAASTQPANWIKEWDEAAFACAVPQGYEAPFESRWLAKPVREWLDHGAENPNWTSEENRRAYAFALKIIPYDFQKPDDTPLRQIAGMAELKPENILMVGEGVSDWRVVYRHVWRPRGVFAFMRPGAADIGALENEINEALRPGKEALGEEGVHCRIDRANLWRDIIDMREGFGTLASMITQQRILWRPYPHTLRVRHHRLSVAEPARQQRADRLDQGIWQHYSL